jgi:hypothetical protein
VLSRVTSLHPTSEAANGRVFQGIAGKLPVETVNSSRARFGGLPCPSSHDSNTSGACNSVGLSYPDSVSNLIRRAQNAISGFKSKKKDLERIDELLQKQ